MNHYFTNDASVQSDPISIPFWCGTKCLTFLTDHGVFSYKEIDDASLKMVQKTQRPSGDVLDLGCGYGFVGIYLKTKYPEIQLTQSDVNERAIKLCKQNCQINNIDSTVLVSDGFNEMKDSFDYIYLNPPIHAGKDLCRRLIDQALSHLNENGCVVVVIRKKHGAKSYIKWFEDQHYNYSMLDKKDDIYVISLQKDMADI